MRESESINTPYGDSPYLYLPVSMNKNIMIQLGLDLNLTSPPSARVAAMSVIATKKCKTRPLNLS